MRVNSDETLRRAIAFKQSAGNAGKSWLDLTREDGARQSSIDLFTGGASPGSSQGDGDMPGSSGR